MTSAKTTTSPQPLTDETAREAVIRDLYALTEFYITHPDFPLPTTIGLYAYTTSEEQVAAMADKWGTTVYGTRQKQMHINLPKASRTVTLFYAAPSDPERPL